MAYVFADSIGGWQGAREREQNRFDVLAQQAARDQERAIASANEADRFAFQAVARDAQLAEDRNRFMLQQALQEQSRTDRLGDVRFNRQLALSQEAREAERQKLARERFETDKTLTQKQLDLDTKFEQQEGNALATRYVDTVQRLRPLAEQLEGLADTENMLRDQALAAELAFDERSKSFAPPRPAPGVMQDPEKLSKQVRLAQELTRDLNRVMKLQEEAKRSRERVLRDQDRVRMDAGRYGAALTERGVEGRGMVFPFPQAEALSAAAESGAVAPGRPVTQVNFVDPSNPSRGLTVPGAAPIPDAAPGPAAQRSEAAARQTNESLTPRPSPAYLERATQGPVPAAQVWADVYSRLRTDDRMFAERELRNMLFKKLGLNPLSEPLRIGNSSLFRNPQDYMKDFVKTKEFDEYWAALPDDVKAQMMESALSQSLSGRKRPTRPGHVPIFIDLPSYGATPEGQPRYQ